ncbi:nucleotidyltransferase domain-containing protein [Halosimplex aquaticum]|uniref:Nucleotidyltransferase domain-containing protein n=1 Tax=Halosimplex aquaticum TaxID=3026162 RepID=A0ABD5Y1M5_9EURY|nr:nucleotidyltransferase domain-containing protein [Halosimplex aquaticum]
MSETAKRGMAVCVDVRPTGDSDVFRIGAADEILRLLADAHETEFTIPELVDATGAARSTVWRAVDLLDGIGVIRVRETPQRNYVSIDPERLRKDDPILAIEQTHFHRPVRAFVEHVRDTFDESSDIGSLVGVVVFGSVARGEADRQSDIDLFVVVDGDRTVARRLVTDVVSDLAEVRFDGDRFTFEPFVESVESAERAGSKLQEIFTEGITVVGSERLSSIRKTVMTDE